MSAKTNISWTDATWNFIRAINPDNGKTGWQCVKVAPECKFCYAEGLNLKPVFGNGLDYTVSNASRVQYVFAKSLNDPLKWKTPKMIFPCSMTDLFLEQYTEDQICTGIGTMIMANHHKYQVLTKRPERMLDFLTKHSDPLYAFVHPAYDNLDEKLAEKKFKEFFQTTLKKDYFNHIIWGCSIGTNAQAKKFLPHMQKLKELKPELHLWVSNEPALEEVDFSGWEGVVDWLVAGGESGKEHRPFDPAWAQSTQNWCDKNDVKFYFKQHGGTHKIDGVWGGDSLFGNKYHAYPECLK